MEIRTGGEFAGYTVIREIGTGGMATVYLVQHPRLPRQDAMKVIHPHVSSDPVFAARFEREAELACTLDHPALVQVHDRGRHEGRLWLTMQFVNGHDADQLLQRDGPMAVDRAVRIVSGIADALDHAHAAGLVHRDVKPANILISHGGTGGERAYLTDFGIAHAANASRQLTDTGDVLATLPYAAPEQLLNQPITGAVDVYALGCVLYELVAGRRLFDQTTPPALMGAVLTGPRAEVWQALPSTASALRDVIARAVSPDPADRFPTCVALAKAAQAATAPASATVAGARLPAAAPGWAPGAAPAAGPPQSPWSTGPTLVPPPPAAPSWQPPPPPWQSPPGGQGGGWDAPGPPGGSGDRPVPAPAGGGRSRRRWPWLAAAAALVLAAALVVWLVVDPFGGLDAPQSVQADARADGVEVRWEPVDGAVEYEVSRDGEAVGRADATTYVDRGVGSGQRVRYTVTALGEGSDRSEPSAARSVVGALHQLDDLTATVDGVQIALTWSPVDGAEHYEVRRDDQVLDDDVSGASHADEAPGPGEYTYTVLAYDEDGGAPPSTTTVDVEISPWLGAAELAAAFSELVPEEPGVGGWGDATCAIGSPLSSSTANHIITCQHPAGVHVEFIQYPDQAAMDARIAFLDTLADPGSARTTDRGGWYRQSPAGVDPAWEAWELTEPDRELMEIYIEWSGHTVADLDTTWYYAAPW